MCNILYDGREPPLIMFMYYMSKTLLLADAAGLSAKYNVCQSESSKVGMAEQNGKALPHIYKL